MSDEEEYEYEYGSDDDYDYGSGDNAEETQDDLIEIENAFYEGDDCRQNDPQKALEMFQKVVKLETERGSDVKWRFKALEHMVTLHLRLGELDKMADRYGDLLQFVGNVTRNESAESINSILDAVSRSPDLITVSRMYEMTLAALKDASNERMWFNTNLKLAKVYMQITDYAKVSRTINELHDYCKLPGGGDDPAKGNYLLEVYGMTVFLCAATNNHPMLKEVYPKIMQLKAAVEDPRLMGGIREEGGKMYMTMGNWGVAYNEFYESFRNYQQAGNARAKECLKYVVLANMLDLSDINPFAAREAKVFQDDREIMAMMDLRMAYEGNDLARFERTLRTGQCKVMEDPFIMTYVDPLRRRMRESVLLNLCLPYRKITIDFMAKELNLEVSEVESLLIDLILDSRINGKIDQISGYLLLEGKKETSSSKKYDALGRWSTALKSLSGHLADTVH